MKRITQALSAFLLLAPVLSPSSLSSQQEGTDVRTGALMVFLDCGMAMRSGCESSHFRTEITFVNWVREVQDSQLNIIFTSASTGSGDEIMLDFIGREELEGIDDQLTYSHSDTDTDDTRTRALTGILAVGIARYAVLAGQEGPFTVNTPEGGEGRPELPPGMQGEVDDPWDYWVFRLGGDVRYEDEDRSDEKRYSANFSANRTTEMWKFSLTGRGTYTDNQRIYSQRFRHHHIYGSPERGVCDAGTFVTPFLNDGRWGSMEEWQLPRGTIRTSPRTSAGESNTLSSPIGIGPGAG